MAAVLPGARAAGPRRRSALCHERRPGRQPGGADPDACRAARGAARPPSGWPRSTRPRCPAGPINDIAAAFASPWAAGSTVGAEPSRSSARRPRWPRRSTSPATPATVRTPPPLLGEDADGILAELGYGGPARSRRSASRRRHLRGAAAARGAASELLAAERQPGQAEARARSAAASRRSASRPSADPDPARGPGPTPTRPNGSQPARAGTMPRTPTTIRATIADPGRRQRRAGQRAREERQRGPRHQEEPVEDARGDDSGRRTAARTGRACRTTAATATGPRTPGSAPIAAIFASRNPARPTGRTRSSAAVPRSFSARDRRRTPAGSRRRRRAGEVLRELVDRVGGGRRRQDDRDD